MEVHTQNCKEKQKHSGVYQSAVPKYFCIFKCKLFEYIKIEKI